MEKLKIFNDFGITPTKNFTAAGYDFYIPDFQMLENYDVDRIIQAFMNSYKLSFEELESIDGKLSIYIASLYGEKVCNNQMMMLNIIHLYLAMYWRHKCTDEIIDCFVSDNLTFDENMKLGIKCFMNDYVFFNSGIKIKMEHNRAGIFFNKSGKGNEGWDTRACVVDEDYSGYVHMSMAFDNYQNAPAILYCGDKLSQMVIIELPKTEVEEVDETTFEQLHKESERGSNGFGSSDIKH